MSELQQFHPDPAESLPFHHADWNPLPGEIRRDPADFRVEEVPLYQPSDEGTHVFFAIEKTGLSTQRAVERIARALDVPARLLAYAGLKDADAVTRQVLSVEHVDPDKIMRVELPQIRVLWARRHPHKLRLGHLSGNRFAIRLRGPNLAMPDAYQSRLLALRQTGVPNYFGPQRFGTRGHTALLGRALLREDYAEMIALLLGRPVECDSGPVRQARELHERGDFSRAAAAWPPSHRDEKAAAAVLARTHDQRKACLAVRPRTRQLYVDAFQSHLFNRVAARRVPTFGRILTGDVAWLHRNGACFLVEDPAREQPRCDAGEISPAGPLFGPRMLAAVAEAASVEQSVLNEEGVREELFSRPSAGKRRGARRPLRVFPTHVGASADSDHVGRFVEVAFSLPPGCYATALLRELSHRHFA